MMAKPHWYLVMAKPKQDEVAETQLAQQGYCVYRPEVILQKQRRGKMVALVESLFPRYLFVKLIEGVDSWGTIRSTKGVQQMVCFGSQYAKVDEALIESIQQREAAIKQQGTQPLYQKGDLLKATSPAFYGIDMVFQSYDADERIIALMNMLGQQQKVIFDPMDVEKA